MCIRDRLEYPDTMEAVKAVNSEVTALAPVLNSPTVTDGVKGTTADENVPVKTLCKRKDGATYVFAASLRDKPTKATFTVEGASRVEVIGEKRTLESPS